jgi:hypothetical protein
LQKLKIIVKYPSYIDLTQSPPNSPWIKQEHGIGGKAEDDTSVNKVSTKREVDRAVNIDDVESTATGMTIKREPGGDNPSTHTQAASEQMPAGPALNTESTNPVRLADSERNKKRKALQDEFDAIELQQKKMRIAKELADLNNED